MKYAYIVTHDYDYEGYSIVTVETSAKKAIAVAENDLSGDYTTVTRYVIGSLDWNNSTMIAQWKRATGHVKYKKMTVTKK